MEAGQGLTQKNKNKKTVPFVKEEFKNIPILPSLFSSPLYIWKSSLQTHTTIHKGKESHESLSKPITAERYALGCNAI
jgi:hypothetical protein